MRLLASSDRRINRLRFYPQYVALVALRERDDRTVGELGKALSVDSSTLSPLLKRMEAAKIVTSDGCMTACTVPPRR